MEECVDDDEISLDNWRKGKKNSEEDVSASPVMIGTIAMPL